MKLIGDHVRSFLNSDSGGGGDGLGGGVVDKIKLNQAKFYWTVLLKYFIGGSGYLSSRSNLTPGGS